jgi:hypothetical protein
VARRVHDVDAGALPDHGGRLGEDGDAALALQVVRVHHPLGDPLVLAERARLLQELVDERRLAVVDVGDDGDVAQVHGGPFGAKNSPAPAPAAGREASDRAGKRVLRCNIGWDRQRSQGGWQARLPAAGMARS